MRIVCICSTGKPTEINKHKLFIIIRADKFLRFDPIWHHLNVTAIFNLNSIFFLSSHYASSLRFAWSPSSLSSSSAAVLLCASVCGYSISCIVPHSRTHCVIISDSLAEWESEWVSEFFSVIRSVGGLLLLSFGLFHFVSVFALHTQPLCVRVCVYVSLRTYTRRAHGDGAIWNGKKCVHK